MGSNPIPSALLPSTESGPADPASCRVKRTCSVGPVQQVGSRVLGWPGATSQQSGASLVAVGEHSSPDDTEVITAEIPIAQPDLAPSGEIATPETPEPAPLDAGADGGRASSDAGADGGRASSDIVVDAVQVPSGTDAVTGDSRSAHTYRPSRSVSTTVAR